MKNLRRIVSVLICIIMAATLCVPSFAAQSSFTIINPYEDVDFETFNQFKGDLHSHTVSSDGHITLKENIEEHYKYGFDFLAISDHGTVSYSWTKPNYDPTIKMLLTIKNGINKVDFLDESGTAANGSQYTDTTVNGDDYYTQEQGKAMLRVPFANEQNPTSFNNAHVNTFFADYGHGILGGTSDYETPISAIDSLGGLSVINHPGEYSGARDEKQMDKAYDKGNFSYKYVINKFENILLKYPTCIGIDINSKGDSRTRFDRKLWDIMLSDLAPQGRNIYAIASSDAHRLDVINSGYIVALMENNTSDELKNCLTSGNFFAESTCVANPTELAAYAKGVETTNPQLAIALASEVEAMMSEISSGKSNHSFKFDSESEPAKITDISVADNKITISGEGIYFVRWISNGNEIATGNEIDLSLCENLGSYVRAEIVGEGVITYTQPFIIDGENVPGGDEVRDLDIGKGVSILSDTIVKALGVFGKFFDLILKMIGAV